MAHPLVDQLRFARSEFRRALVGLSEQDAQRRVGQMNSIAWIVGHLASQEQRNWLTRMQNTTPMPELETLYGYGSPPSTPALGDVWRAWEIVVPLVDTFLYSLDASALQQPMLYNGQRSQYAIGTVLQRHIYHYWYHLGECMSIRQALGHTNLPDFVGDLHGQAPYRPG